MKLPKEQRLSVGTIASDVAAFTRPVAGSVRAQFSMTRRSVEELRAIVVMPIHALIFMAVFNYVGRQDLAAYSLVAPMLMSVGQMGFFMASELLARERYGQTLELVVAAPSPLWLIILSRITVMTVLSLLGIVVSWLIIRLVFGVTVTVQHPLIFGVTLMATTLAAAGTTLITAALFSIARNARTYQNSILYPMFLLGGILVPITAYPEWVQPVSRVVYLYWSANLLRDSMQEAAPAGVLGSLGAITALGVGGAVIGIFLIRRMLDKLRREGTLGLL